MPDDAPQTPSTPSAPNDPSAPAAQPAPPAAPIPFDISEEFGTARKNLPSARILLISVAAIAVIASIIAFVQRPQQKAKGAIENIAAVDVPSQGPGQSLVMVGLEVSIDNRGEKPFIPRDVKAEVDTDQGTLSDQAASAVDVPRYVQAYPALAGDGVAPLQFLTPVQPGAQTKGIIVVTFPITADAFAKRKALRVTITGPEQLVPLVLTK